MSKVITPIVLELSKMSNIFRYSGTRVNLRENLAEHSYYVALISDILSKDISERYDIKIDREQVLRYALVHDLEEMYTGDIIWPVKSLSPALANELNIVWGKLLSEGIGQKFPKNIGDEILSNHKNYEDFKYDKLENRIVKFSDGVQVIMYSLSELESGNHYFNETIINTRDWMNDKWGDDKYFSPYMKEINELTKKFK